MSTKPSKKRKKARIKYYEAPPKSRAAYFFASFFTTLFFLLSVIGLYIVNKNSMRVGFGMDVQTFSISNTSSGYEVSVAGERFSIDKNYIDAAYSVIGRLRAVKLENEPEPLYFFDVLKEGVKTSAFELMKYYDPLKPAEQR